MKLRSIAVGVVALGIHGCGAADGGDYIDDTSERLGASEECAALDDPSIRPYMSSALETALLYECDRTEELSAALPKSGSESGGESAASAPGAPSAALIGSNVLVNNPAGDAGGATHTQSETSIARNPFTGTLCASYNDSYSGVVLGTGFSGFSRSTNNGASFADRGPVPAGSAGPSRGDPSVVWRLADGKFYTAQLEPGGLGLWRSDDDCNTFAPVTQLHSGVLDDKEIMAVDNNLLSPYFGRLYVVWTDFAAGGRIYLTSSSDAGATWSTPVALSAPGGTVQGAWPLVAPSGALYVAWSRYQPNDKFDIEVVASLDGGASFGPVNKVVANADYPFASTAESNCGRPALNGNIRIAPFPQLAASTFCIHMVYTAAPNAAHTGDVANIYYKRTCNGGLTWSAAKQINDDGTATDQFTPSVSAGPEGYVSVAWYDRRLSPSNTSFDYYQRVSITDGRTFKPSERLSSTTSPIYIDPSLNVCYHGDYDMQVQTAASARMLWSSEVNVQDGHPDPDIWFQRSMLPGHPSCNNFFRNGEETDIDCGGPCKGCGVLQACAVDTDCVEGLVCSPGLGNRCFFF